MSAFSGAHGASSAPVASFARALAAPGRRILDAVGIFMGLIKEREDQWNGFPSKPDTRE